VKRWEYELGELQVIFDSGRTYKELGWGPYQFTQLRRTTKGEILYSWELGNDKIEDYVELDDHRLYWVSRKLCFIRGTPIANLAGNERQLDAGGACSDHLCDLLDPFRNLSGFAISFGSKLVPRAAKK